MNFFYRSAGLLLLVALGSGSVQGASGTFTDWTAADSSAETASGTLGFSTVALSTTVVAGLSGGGVVSSVLDGTFTGFSTSAFTPSIASTDGIGFASASSFAITFSVPVLNPILHLYQLADSTLNFSAPFTLLSSDGNLSPTPPVVSTSVRGFQGATDANGSLLFPGVFSQLSWTATNANSNDGVIIQISALTAVPEPSTYALFLAGLGLVGVAARRRRRVQKR